MNKYITIQKKVASTLRSLIFMSFLCVLPLTPAYSLSELEAELTRAMAGDNAAQNRVGEIYLYGKGGTSKNPTQAIEWFVKATENGNPFAPNHLAVIYATGNGVNQSWKKAAEYLKSSAKRGYYLAQKNLAVAYEEGNGVEQDYVEAYVWAVLSVESSQQSHNISPEMQQECLETKERIESALSKDQLKEAMVKLENYRSTIEGILTVRQPIR